MKAIGLWRQRRALEQTVSQLLVLMILVSSLSITLAVVKPILDQYTSRNRIREAEALMASLYNEILKVQEEPAGSRRIVQLQINRGGIELANHPSRMVYYVKVPKKVNLEVWGMDFAYTGRGAMLRKNLSLPLLRPTFIGPGSNVVYITKMEGGRLNVTSVTYA